MIEVPERYEYGYRLADGLECWERETVAGESRILAHEGVPVGEIVLRDDDGTDIVETIRAALAAANLEAVILRRMVATTIRDTEVIATVEAS